jgi:hypothetical protein
LKTADPAAYQNYLNNQQEIQTGTVSAINELMKRGVTYEQLGQLPVSGGWANQNLAANDPLNALYASNAGKFDTEGQQFLNSATQRTAPQQYFNAQGEGGNWETLPEQLSVTGFGNVSPADLTMQNLFQAAQGTGAMGLDSQGHDASGLITGMYGGPLWAALARTLSPTWQNAGGPEAGSLQSLIQQHFDPWAVMRGQWGANPSSVGTSLMPILQSAAYQRSYGSQPGME